jgi:hypothetical protein
MRHFFKSQQEMDKSFKAVRENVLPRIRKLCGKRDDKAILLATYVVVLDCLKETGVTRAELRAIGDMIYPEQPPVLKVVEQ